MPRMSVKIHHEGTNTLIMLAMVLLALNALVWLFIPLSWLCILLSGISLVAYLFVFNFFRCPKRKYTGERRGTVVSSVDGKVVVIEETVEPEFIGGKAIQVSVFMSPLNVHANWFPVDGEVIYAAHHSGRYLSAYLPKASIENEHSTIGILTPEGYKVTVRQIAGAMARRIVTYVKAGEKASIDDHLGFIKFGSRVDIFLPIGTEIFLTLGQTTRGGLTPLGKLPSTVD